MLPELGCLFPFPGQEIFQLLHLQIFSQSLFISLFLLGSYNANISALNVVSEVSKCSHFFLFLFTFLLGFSDF